MCRFLLTHLPSPQTALLAWANVAAPLSTLLIHEIEQLESNHPALRRYYELVEEMQRHYGQKLSVGATLDATLLGPDGECSRAGALVVERSARDMAQLHLPNLRTWGKNENAAQAFDRRELDQPEARHSIP